MYPFLESIRLEQQKLHFMVQHEARFRRTQLNNWGQVHYDSVERLIQNHPDFPRDQRKYKCRVVYSPDEVSIGFIPYIARTITRLQSVEADHISYPYKSTDRSCFATVSESVASAADTEILIFKNGLLTDTSFSNIALFDGKQWWTPKTPLLAGVHRSFLLEKGMVRLRDITWEDLTHFETVRLINAMVSWEAAWELPVSCIQ